MSKVKMIFPGIRGKDTDLNRVEGGGGGLWRVLFLCLFLPSERRVKFMGVRQIGATIQDSDKGATHVHRTDSHKSNAWPISTKICQHRVVGWMDTPLFGLCSSSWGCWDAAYDS